MRREDDRFFAAPVGCCHHARSASCRASTGHGSLALLHFRHDPVEDFRRELLAGSERLQDIHQHEPKPDDFAQLRAGGRLAAVTGQFVKNEPPDEFAALLAPPFANASKRSVSLRLSFDETFVSRNDARCSAVCAIASSLRSGIFTFDLAGILGDTWVFSRIPARRKWLTLFGRLQESLRIPSTTLGGMECQ
jgi:hypothetical protein